MRALWPSAPSKVCMPSPFGPRRRCCRPGCFSNQQVLSLGLCFVLLCHLQELPPCAAAVAERFAFTRNSISPCVTVTAGLAPRGSDGSVLPGTRLLPWTGSPLHGDVYPGSAVRCPMFLQPRGTCGSRGCVPIYEHSANARPAARCVPGWSLAILPETQMHPCWLPLSSDAWHLS